MQGRVKLHRKIQENCISTNLELLWLLSYILTKANHQSGSFFIWNIKVELLPWQFIRSVRWISEKFWLSIWKTQRLLKTLEDEKIVIHKWYSKYSLFTIINRDSYQWTDTQIDTQIDTQTIRRQTTNKNDKNKKEWKEVIVSEKDLRDWVDNWASNRFNSDTKINPTVLRTIISMMDIWFIVDKTEKRLQEIKLKLCDKMRLYYTLWDGTLQLIRFEDEVWKRKEHWRDNPPRNHLNSLWNRLIPYEVRNPKK